jgi:hypothetical protein
MKLSEARFKPLLLRLLEWADAGRAEGRPAAGAAGLAGLASLGDLGGGGGAEGAAGLGRPATLFGAAVALTRQLRSVFVPYFRSAPPPPPTPPPPPSFLNAVPSGGPALGPPCPRLQCLFTVPVRARVQALKPDPKSQTLQPLRYLVEPAARALSDVGGPGGERPRKKKKKGSADAAAAGAGADPSSASPADEEDGWVLRVRALRALHRAFRHDADGFFTHERLERLLPVLVAQLEAAPPPAGGAAAAAVEAQCEDAELDGETLAGCSAGAVAGAAAGGQRGGGHLDVSGLAAVGALAQMAVAANSDAFWKPLNHRVRAPRGLRRRLGPMGSRPSPPSWPCGAVRTRLPPVAEGRF